MICWKRRSRAPSFSMYLRYSSRVVAPMHWISPRARAGLRTLEASMAPFGPAGADQGVQLVDEQDGVLGPADLVHDGLDAFLELAAVLGAGDHHGQVEDDDAAVAEQLGDVAVHDHLGQALDDGGLADAGLAEEHGVVLGPAAEHLDDALDLVLPADDRVELALAGQLGEVASEAVEGGSLGLALVGGSSFTAPAAFAGFQCCAPASSVPPRARLPASARGS